MRPGPRTLGLLAGGLVLVALAPATGDALGRLAAARAREARVAAEAAAPPPAAPLVQSALRIPAPDAGAARAAMKARVEALARSGAILVEAAEPAAAPVGVAALDLRVSGSEKAILAFADALERDRPVLRLSRWRLDPVPGGVRLRGLLVGAWQ